MDIEQRVNWLKREIARLAKRYNAGEPFPAKVTDPRRGRENSLGVCSVDAGVAIACSLSPELASVHGATAR